jgi:hypothetical protein
MSTDFLFGIAVILTIFAFLAVLYFISKLFDKFVSKFWEWVK